MENIYSGAFNQASGELPSFTPSLKKKCHLEVSQCRSERTFKSAANVEIGKESNLLSTRKCTVISAQANMRKNGRENINNSVDQDRNSNALQPDGKDCKITRHRDEYPISTSTHFS